MLSRCFARSPLPIYALSAGRLKATTISCTNPNAIFDQVVFISLELSLETMQFDGVGLVGTFYPLLVDVAIGVGGSEGPQLVTYGFVLLDILSISQHLVYGKLERIHGKDGRRAGDQFQSIYKGAA